VPERKNSPSGAFQSPAKKIHWLALAVGSSSLKATMENNLDFWAPFSFSLLPVAAVTQTRVFHRKTLLSQSSDLFLRKPSKSQSSVNNEL